MNTTGLLAAGVVASLSMATVPHAAAQERSLDEIKKEVMRRAGHINPFEGICREDAAQVVASLNTLTIDMPGTGENSGGDTSRCPLSPLSRCRDYFRVEINQLEKEGACGVRSSRSLLPLLHCLRRQTELLGEHADRFCDFLANGLNSEGRYRSGHL